MPRDCPKLQPGQIGTPNIVNNKHLFNYHATVANSTSQLEHGSRGFPGKFSLSRALTSLTMVSSRSKSWVSTALASLAVFTLAVPAQALYFYLENTSPKCFYEELPRDTLVVGEFSLTITQWEIAGALR